MANPGAKAPEACFLAMYRGYRGNCFGGRGPFCPRNTGHCSRAHCAGLLPGVQITVGSAVASSRPARISAAIHPGPVQADLLTHGLLSGCRPKQPCRLEPFIRNAISRDKSVHEPIVRRPAHPRRLVGVLVIGRVAAKPQAQLASAPEGERQELPLIRLTWVFTRNYRELLISPIPPTSRPISQILIDAWKMPNRERMSILSTFEIIQQQQHVHNPDIRKVLNSLPRGCCALPAPRTTHRRPCRAPSSA